MVHHKARRAYEGPAGSWCDECGSANPVWFKGQGRADVIALCAECAPRPGKVLRDRLAVVGSGAALRERVVVGA